MKVRTALALCFLLILYASISSLGIRSVTPGNLDPDWSRFFIWPIISQFLLFIAGHLLILLAITCSVLIPAQPIPKERPTAYFAFVVLLSMAIAYALTGFAVQHFPWLEISTVSGSISGNQRYVIIGYLALSGFALTVLISLMSRRLTRLKKFALLVSFAFLLFPSAKTGFNHSLHAEADDLTNFDVQDLNQSQVTESATLSNVIFIGLDSIAPRHILDNSGEVPTLAALISSGQQYTQAYTPIGRTFAAWNTILSGRWPASNKVRFNLDKFHPDQIADMLQNNLKKLGYYNLYALDERRFNNINEEYGFDEVIGPPVGVIDFFIPHFADNLFSAYFTDTWFGRLFFPSLNANRAAGIVYNPDQFVDNILSATKSVHQPLFLASHFCLVHYPYRWQAFNQELLNSDEVKLHTVGLKRLDKQVKRLLSGLRAQGKLDNAIIVLLSDHGEGLGSEPGIWVTSGRKELSDFILLPRGHGNSLMVTDQVNVILNIHDTRTNTTDQVFDTAVSLVDIRPTVLNMLGIAADSNIIDGKLLPGTQSGSSTEATATDRFLYMETAMLMPLPPPDATPEQLLALLKDKLDGYWVTSEGRLELTREYAEVGMQRKQYAVLHQNQILLSSPNSKDYLWVDTLSGQWQRFDPNQRQQAERQVMISKLQCYISGDRSCYTGPSKAEDQ
tara:strand:+ start:4048 stop:6072 length:2025 start_codon:yes stop_codon:yes gene_type:complete